MEQTLGKRIGSHRKKKGLTQDQLAEQLGVTAQAVSKWENDQSCPDITTLPKLADIFGCTTDELLGVEPAHKVQEAELVTSFDNGKAEGLHISRDGFEFKLESGGRKGAIGFAVLVLAVGGLYLAAQLLKWDVSFWGILWPTAVLVFGLFGSIPFPSFGSLGCVAFGAYFLLDNLNVLPFELGWELALPIALLIFGISLLMKAIRKPHSRSLHFSHDGTEHITSSCVADDETFTCDNTFCNESYRIDLPILSRGNIDNSFGTVTVDLSGVKAVSEDCAINIEVAFGQSTVLVPSKYHVTLAKDTAFGSIRVKGNPAATTDGTIRINADVAFGEITIAYI